VNVSTTGARLRGSDLPQEGEELLLSVDSVRAFGTVVWSESGECGVAFDTPLAIEEAEALRYRAAKTAGFTPELKAALDDWTLGLAR
jgi:hypothetical protein